MNGEIDLIDTSIIYLTKVRAIIKLVDKDNIIITSNFGKYNIDNYDTIFTDNVKIDYTENTITGEYLDFSLNKNKMIISRNVIFTNLDNILKADVIEVNVSTKDTKIFMYNTKKKVKVKNKD